MRDEFKAWLRGAAFIALLFLCLHFVGALAMELAPGVDPDAPKAFVGLAVLWALGLAVAIPWLVGGWMSSD